MSSITHIHKYVCIYFLLYVYGCFICTYVCAPCTTCMLGTQEGQKGHPLWVLETTGLVLGQGTFGAPPTLAVVYGCDCVPGDFAGLPAR